MNRSGADIRASETQSKVLQDRISAIEKHLGSLCDTFGSYTRKTARLRDKGDLLCKELVEYGDYEKWNPTLRKGLNQFAESLSAIQDYREAQVNRLERKVVFHLSQYGQLCKLTKNDLKGAFSTQQKESQQKKKLEQIRTKTPQNRQQISQAEKELSKASVESSRSQLAVEQQMETFERKKIQDMRNILREFANIELLFHAKALELYTECFKSLEDVDPEADLEEFQKQIQPPSTSRTTLARSASQQSLNSQQDSQGNAPRPQRGQAPSSRMRTEDMDDDDDEEDDEDEDEDDDDDDDDDDDYTEGESTARSSNIASKSKKQ